jgi:hypothetical protein
MLEKVLGVSAVRSGPYLVAIPSHVGVDVDRIAYPLCYPPPVGVGLVYSLWFWKVLLGLVAKALFGGVAALMGPHAVTIRLGPGALGPTLSGLIAPCGAVLSSDHPYPRVCQLLRWFALLWWRRFESLGGACHSCMLKGRCPLVQT